MSKELTFVCPECGCNDIEEDAEQVTSQGTITLYSDGEIDSYGVSVNWYSAKCIFTCQECGFEIPVTRRRDLVRYLLENKMVEA